MDRLIIQNLSIAVHLGCTREEQQSAQEVRVSVEVDFSTPPNACQTDRLTDTICYAKVCEALKAAAITEFHTVEHLAAVMFKAIRPLISEEHKFTLRLQKVRPPIEDLLGGVIYEKSSQ